MAANSQTASGNGYQNLQNKYRKHIPKYHTHYDIKELKNRKINKNNDIFIANNHVVLK
jgi:hypothetical protein